MCLCLYVGRQVCTKLCMHAVGRYWCMYLGMYLCMYECMCTFMYEGRYVYQAQMTRDFAADLANVFWHMTWDLCIDFAMGFYFTHDMGVMRRPNGQAFFHFFDR